MKAKLLARAKFKAIAVSISAVAFRRLRMSDKKSESSSKTPANLFKASVAGRNPIKFKSLEHKYCDLHKLLKEDRTRIRLVECQFLHEGRDMNQHKFPPDNLAICHEA